MKKVALFVWLAAMGMNNWCFADIPQAINFQGRLTNSSGAPLVDGTYPITVSLYTQKEGGTAVWNDLFSVATKNGYFNLSLGSDGTAKPFSNVLFDQPLFVGIQVDHDAEMTPRQPMNTVPYAMMSMNGVPIGTVMAWHKSMNNTPPLSSQWAECNGQPINDKDSPYYGQNLPNLNVERRFLRGDTVSGVPENDALQTHVHARNPNNFKEYYLTDHPGGSHWPAGTVSYGESTVTGAPDSTSARIDSETRPINMSVVWIMKVK